MAKQNQMMACLEVVSLGFSGHYGDRVGEGGKGQGEGAAPHPVGQEKAGKGEWRGGPEPFM